MTYIKTMVLFLTAFLFTCVSLNAQTKDTKAICLECHSKAASLFNKSNVHKPVMLGLCTACHNPHASRYDKLLGYAANELCYSCHEKKKILAGEFLHKPLEEGECLKCHDSHSSNAKGLLKMAKAEMCYSCHPKEDVAGKKNVHPEVKKGNCLACHEAHSSNVEGLLTKVKTSVCSGCHPSSERLTVAHSGYQVSGANCLSCHSAHSSDSKAILGSILHKPFEEKKCQACHIAGSQKLVKNDSTLCTGCHESTIAGFNKRYSHMNAGKEENFCSNCHSPHASDEAGLIKNRVDRVCYACHSDTKAFAAGSKHIHPKLRKCSNCHVSHASNDRYFMAKGDGTCGTAECHPTQGVFTHPVGETIIDPRSKAPLNCSTCHNPMGSPEEYILRAGKDRELCVLCHQL